MSSECVHHFPGEAGTGTLHQTSTLPGWNSFLPLVRFSGQHPWHAWPQEGYPRPLWIQISWHSAPDTEVGHSKCVVPVGLTTGTCVRRILEDSRARQFGGDLHGGGERAPRQRMRMRRGGNRPRTSWENVDAQALSGEGRLARPVQSKVGAEMAVSSEPEARGSFPEDTTGPTVFNAAGPSGEYCGFGWGGGRGQEAGRECARQRKSRGSEERVVARHASESLGCFRMKGQTQ